MQRIMNFSQLETEINQNGELVITKENNNLIVMNMEEYKRKILQKDIEKHLLKAEEDIEKGKTRSAREVFKEWKEKYGI